VIRAFAIVSVLVAVAVPVFTLREVPRFTVWPVLLGLVPFVIGKYVLCPLRWHAVSVSGRDRRWHLRVHAESELLGMLTPGHVGGDMWRMRQLTKQGMPKMLAATDVGLDRFVGAVGLTLFVGLAAAALPLRMLLVAGGAAGLTFVVALVVKRIKPQWVPDRRMPSPGRLALAVVLTIAYQASIVLLLLATINATGHTVNPFGLIGAFGASQLAGAVPGPQGASPRDAALVVALAALGVPWAVALGAVTLKATLAWGPALLLGGGFLWLGVRAAKRVVEHVHEHPHTALTA
jgi:hypothetical protein